MNTETITVSKEELAQEYASLVEGKVPQNTINSGVQVLAAQTTAYPANGSIASMIIYMKCQCTIKGGKTFDGDAWGISIPGGGALMGDVYTDNINALYANTTNFDLIATSVYTTFIFKDKNGNVLGSFQAGSVSTVNGTGHGSGSWS